MWLLLWLSFGLFWGFMTRSVIRSKEYTDDTGWFWYGFFFHVIAFTAALCKEEKVAPRYKMNYEIDEEILESGGWKCSCGRVNSHYVTACVCGQSKPPAALPVQDAPSEQPK